MKALFIGRFQPLHKGHIEIIRRAASESDELIIVIGSSQESGTETNPYSAEEREEMLRLAIKDECIENYRIVAVPDINCDEGWVEHVIKVAGKVDVVYAAENQLTSKLFKEAGYKIVTTSRLFRISSTEIRKRIREGKKWEDLVPPAIVQYLFELSKHLN